MNHAAEVQGAWWIDAVYWSATFSNLGPFTLYLLIMWATLGGLSVPKLAQQGSRVFFAGCALTHVVMLLMLVAMPVYSMMGMLEPWIVLGLLATHLALNIIQTIGGALFAGIVAQQEIRSIEF